MKLKMTVYDALNFADEWSKGLTLHEGSEGWRVVCMVLASEVRALRKDAERYRWLRDKCNHVRVGVHIQFSSDERDADAAIDAAMQGANA